MGQEGSRGREPEGEHGSDYREGLMEGWGRERFRETS